MPSVADWRVFRGVGSGFFSGLGTPVDPASGMPTLIRVMKLDGPSISHQKMEIAHLRGAWEEEEDD
jgi:hypothetical protein